MKLSIKKMILISSIIISIIILSLTASNSKFLDDTMRKSPIKNNNSNSSVYELQNRFHKIYNQYKDSIVFISTEKTVKLRYNNPFMEDPFFKQFFGPRKNIPKTRKRKGLGTGFIISSDGYICTNHHVVANMDSVTVKVNDKEYKAKFIGSDPMTDIALLKIKGKKDFKPVYFGNSDKVKIGDMTIAIGNPFGLDKTLTTGIVSATGRRAVDQVGNSHIQTDASINPGNSGGPLINVDGEVIGVNRMIYSRTGGNLGIGFAIPVNTVKKTLVQLKKYGKVKRGYIGVQISPLTAEFAKELGLKKPEGALVGSVMENSPAEKSGLMLKDVIIKVNGKKIYQFKDLIKIVGETRIGKTIQVTVWRNKNKVNLWVTIKERP